MTAAATAVPDWTAIERQAAPYVYRIDSYTCVPWTTHLCHIYGYGTGYAVRNKLGVQLITARHMACNPSMSHWVDLMKWLEPNGSALATLYSTTDRGMCKGAGNAWGYTWPNMDTEAWIPDKPLSGGIPVQTIAPKPGDPILVLGNPEGMAPGVPIAVTGHVSAVDVTFTEAAELGMPARRITGAIKITADSLPGNSGSPVLNAHGQVIGTVVAGNPQVEPNGAARLVAYLVPLPSQIVNSQPYHETSRAAHCDLLDHLLGC